MSPGYQYRKIHKLLMNFAIRQAQVRRRANIAHVAVQRRLPRLSDGGRAVRVFDGSCVSAVHGAAATPPQ